MAKFVERHLPAADHRRGAVQRPRHAGDHRRAGGGQGPRARAGPGRQKARPRRPHRRAHVLAVFERRARLGRGHRQAAVATADRRLRVPQDLARHTAQPEQFRDRDGQGLRGQLQDHLIGQGTALYPRPALLSARDRSLHSLRGMGESHLSGRGWARPAQPRCHARAAPAGGHGRRWAA